MTKNLKLSAAMSQRIHKMGDLALLNRFCNFVFAGRNPDYVPAEEGYAIKKEVLRRMAGKRRENK